MIKPCMLGTTMSMLQNVKGQCIYYRSYDSKPIFYMRETDLNKFRSSAVHKMIRPGMSSTWTITQDYYLLNSNPLSNLFTNFHLF